MSDRVITNERERELMVRFIEAHKLPFVVTIKDGRHRTLEQNKLQRQWCNDLSPQLGLSPEEVRGLLKLQFGIPILRAASDAFREKYDRILKRLPQEMKTELMMEPINIPVTSLMSVKQKTEYLDSIFRFFSDKGYALTIPDHGLLKHVEAGNV